MREVVDVDAGDEEVKNLSTRIEIHLPVPLTCPSSSKCRPLEIPLLNLPAKKQSHFSKMTMSPLFHPPVKLS
jgi:hypothetical protein